MFLNKVGRFASRVTKEHSESPTAKESYDIGSTCEAGNIILCEFFSFDIIAKILLAGY